MHPLACAREPLLAMAGTGRLGPRPKCQSPAPTYRDWALAEGVGFEPTVPFGTPVFKTGAFDHSATPP